MGNSFLSRDGKSYGWFVLASFTLNYSIVIIAIESLGLLLPQISQEFSLSPTQKGWLASSVLLSNLLFEIPSNWFFSRFRPWRVTCLSFLLAALFTAFNGWAPTFALLIIARVGLGLIYLSSEAPRTLVILYWVPRRQIGVANGIAACILEGVIGIGFIAIPMILNLVDTWRNTLYAWAGVCVISAGLWLLVGKERVVPEMEPSVESRGRSPLGTIFKYREPWLLGMGMAGVIGARSAFSAFWPTYTGEEYGTSLSIAGLVLGIISVARVPVILGVTFSSFISRRTPLLLMACGVGVCATCFGLLNTGFLPLLFLISVLNGMSLCFFPAMMTTLYRLPGIGPREVAVAASLMFAMMWGGAALGPLVTGFIQETTGSLRLALSLVALGPLVLTASGLVLQSMRRKEVGVGTAPSTVS